MRLPLASLTLVASLAACADDPPTPAEVRAKLAKDLVHVITESDAGWQAAAEAAPGDAAMAMIDRALGESDSEVVARVRARVGRFVIERAVKQAFRPEDEVETDPAQEIVDELNEKLFTDANHVGEGVYRVPAELVCMTETVDDAGTVSESLDEECASRIDAAELRVRVTTDDDAMQFTLQVTKDREEPFAVTLEPSSVALKIDLDDAMRSATAMAMIAGEELPNARLSGVIVAKLAVLGPAHAQASFSIDRDLSIALAGEGTSLDGPDAFKLDSRRADVVAFSADGPNQAGTLKLGLAETTLHVPPLFEEVEGEGSSFELDLAGLTANATFAVGQPLVVTCAGLGDRDLVTKVNGKVASTISLNADAGRAFDLTITDDLAAGTSTIQVAPKLDLRTFEDHAAQGDAPVVYDVTRVLLTGALMGDAAGSTVRVLDGDYMIETNPTGYGFATSAGNCVTSSEALDATSGATYTQYSVAACPSLMRGR